MTVMTIPEAWYIQERTLTVEDMEYMPDDEFRYERSRTIVPAELVTVG